MHFTAQQTLDDAVSERAFTIGDIPGLLWTPATVSASEPAPIIVLGQPGSLGTQRMYPRLAARARAAAADGFAVATLEMPGTGGRPPLPGSDRARADLAASLAAGTPPTEDTIDRLVLPLVDAVVPEWQTMLDEVLDLPEVGGAVGVSGGVIAVGTRLAAIDARVAAAGLFAGSYVPRTTIEEARGVSAPLHVLLQWDDAGNDRARSLELFDAFGSAEKTLSANTGGHTGVPAFAGDEAARFFARHLGGAATR
ncbi:alpha/beta hydrolase [Microbacterium sp. M1A1_1b]